MRKVLLCTSVGLALFVSSKSQINIPARGEVIEKFAALAPGKPNVKLPANWKLSAPGFGNHVVWTSPDNVQAMTLRIDDGLPTIAGTVKNDEKVGRGAFVMLYGEKNASDKALMAHYRNKTGKPISSLIIAFEVKPYANLKPAYDLSLATSTDGTSWTMLKQGAVANSVFKNRDGGSLATAENPEKVIKILNIKGLHIANKGDFYLRWLFTPVGNAAPGSGISLDNVSLGVGSLNIPAPSIAATLVDEQSVDVNNNNQVNEGDELTYTSTVTNTGDADATGITYNGTLDANTTLVANSVVTSALARNDVFSTSVGVAITSAKNYNVLGNDFGLPSVAVVSYGTTASGGTTTAVGGEGVTDHGGSISINAAGVITNYTPPAAYAGTDGFAYVARDVNGVGDDAAIVTITLPDIIFGLVSPADPRCHDDNDGSVTIMASGGVAPLTYSINGTDYFASNVFNNLGAGPYTLYVQDAGGYVKTTNITLTNPAAIVVSMVGGSISNLIYNTAVSSGSFSNTGGTGSITWSASGLPSGVAIDASTGALTGTPTQTGIFTANITATDGNNCAGNLADVTVKVAPKLTTDTYGTSGEMVGNTQLVADGHSSPATPFTTSATNILANDQPAGIAVTTGTFTTTNNGSITVDASGKFTYTPPVGATSDSYTYMGSSNGVSATSTINFSMTGMVWYVNSAGSNGTGLSSSPFNSLGNASTSAQMGQTIYIHTGGSLTPGTTTLKANQTLRGAGTALTVGALSLPAGTKPILSGTVVLASGVTADGFDLNTTTTGLVGITNNGSTVTGITVDMGDITTIGGSGVTLSNSGNTGSMSFTSITASGATNGVNINNFSSPGTVTINSGNITNTTNTGMTFANVARVIMRGVTINETSQTALSLASTFIQLNGSLAIATTAGGNGVQIGNGITSILGGTNVFSITNTGSGQGLVANTGLSSLQITGSNNTISTQTGTALNFTATTVGAVGGITFASVSSNGAISGINLLGVVGSGTMTINGGTLIGGAGPVMRIRAGDVKLIYKGSVSQANAQPLISIAQGEAGTITFQTGSLSATNGTGLQFDNVDGTYNFNGTTTLNGGDAGIDILNGCGGNFNFSGSTSITNPTNEVIKVDAGTANVTYSGSFTKNNNAVTGILINGETAGTIAINGTGTKTLSTTTANAISLTNNTGATINFSGNNLSITTTSGIGFNATGGGIISVAGTGNTISSSTATALNVGSTTIGAIGLTFQSISSIGGSATGIILNSTGTAAANGSLTVTGTGSAGTGGTIANKTGSDGSTSTGIGIYVTNTKNPSLSWMQLNDFQNYAIRGVSVSGFNLANSIINAAAGSWNGTTDMDPNNEGSISFDDLTGAASITGCNISRGFKDNVRIKNSSGTLNRITFSSVTIGTNHLGATAADDKGNDGLIIEALGNALINATVQNSTFTAARGDLFLYNNNSSSSGDLVFTNNTLSNNYGRIATDRGGVTLSGGVAAGMTTSMNITGNTFRDAVGIGVLIVKPTGASTLSGTFTNNIIGVSGVPNSGSAEGSALKIQNTGQGAMNITVTNNQIYQYNNYGIEYLMGGAATAFGGSINTTITGNTIKQPGNTQGTLAIPKNGLHFNIGTVPGDTYVLCAQIGGAGALSNNIGGSGADVATALDFRLRQRQNTTIQLRGYSGANNDNNAVVNYVISQNNAISTPTGIASNTVGSGGNGYINSPGGNVCF